MSTAPPPGSADHLPPGMSPADLRIGGRGSLTRAWAEAWQDAPGAPALIDATGGTITYGGLADATAAVAGRLHGAGLTAGDRVLFNAAPSVALALAHVAALRAGLVVVPANPAYSARELAHIATDARPRAAIVDDATRAGWLREALPGLLVTGTDVALPQTSAPGLDASGPGDLAMIIYTSGTTGTPKGAMLTHGNLLAGCDSVALAWRWTASDRLILALPLFHAHGLCVALHGALLAASSLILLRRFDVQAVADAVTGGRASLFFGVPTMYHRLAAAPAASALRKLRLCVSGSAPLSAELHGAVRERTGQVVLERYGLTETLMVISNPYDGERRPGSVGLPLPGVDVQLSATSEILVRGPSVFAGYWEMPEATAASLEEGWFATGDIGARDADGYYRILGRTKELIISGGYNVYPREVEDVLATHPGVAEAAVVGVSSAEWGEVVTAFVVARESTPTEAELTDFLATRLAAYKRPRQYRFVEALPRNAMGKVLRQRLT